MKRTAIYYFLLSMVILVASGCQTNSQNQILEASQSQVKLRSIQTKSFDTTDKKKVMRAVISTLQDLDFLVNNASMLLGTVSGIKFGSAEGGRAYQMKITVTVRPRGKTQMLVRANAQYNLMAVEDPKPYQDFFTALGKALFLTAQNLD